MKSEFSSSMPLSLDRRNLWKPLLILLAVVGIVVVLYANAPLGRTEDGISRAVKTTNSNIAASDIQTTEDLRVCSGGKILTTQGCRSENQITRLFKPFENAPRTGISEAIRDILKNTGTDQEYLDLLQGNLDNNKLLLDHSNFFQNSSGHFGRIYKIGVDQYTIRHTPNNLAYHSYSAVGYGLANSILLVNNNGFILIDSGSNTEQADIIIEAYQSAGVIPRNRKIPLRAIIYTHNHIDHTGGSDRWVERAIRPACPMNNDGKDGTFTARRHCVEIICHYKVVGSVVNTATRTGQQIDGRSGYMYGLLNVAGPINNGIGPFETFGESTFHPPSKTFSDALKVNVNRMQLYLKYAPSETSDEIIIFVPDKFNRVRSQPAQGGRGGRTVYTAPVAPQALGRGFLASAEVIQGPSFPNLYSLRGTTFRNPLTWYSSVDILRLYDAWAMVPSHGVPLMGTKNIQTLLVNFRDAIQHVHDQTLRYIRLGYIPDELVTMVKLPNYILRNLGSVSNGLPTQESPPLNPQDYLRTFYGSVPQSIRELYSGYLGWNKGDPTYFKPLPPVKRANRYVKQFGGVSAAITSAGNAYSLGKVSGKKEEFQWAAELLTYVLRCNIASANQKRSARLLKGKAFLQLAQTKVTNSAKLEADWFSLNPNWRNWLIVGAEELALHVSKPRLAFPAGAGLNAPKIQGGVPPQYWVQQWCWRFNSENQDLNGKTFGWQFEPSLTFWGSKRQRFVLHVAKKVVRMISDELEIAKIWSKIDYKVSIDHEAFSKLIDKDATLSLKSGPYFERRRFMIEFRKLLRDGSIRSLKGRIRDIVSFYSPERFDPVPAFIPPVVDR